MSHSMQIKFDGQSHSIDANTLIHVLTHYQVILNEANKQLGRNEKEITLKVNAIEKGSFVIDISVVQNIIQQLFSVENTNYIASLVTIVGGIFGLYKVFKGTPIKDKDKDNAQKILEQTTNITNNKTINNITLNVYNQPITREAVSKTFEEVDNEPNVSGFSVSAKDANMNVEFVREEFKGCIYNDFDNEEEIANEINEDVDAILTIISLSFEANSRWQFMYQGFKIGMFVKDDALMKAIDDGERFGKGDTIKVKMRINKRFNKTYKAYENKSYKILEFYAHIIPPKEQILF